MQPKKAVFIKNSVSDIVIILPGFHFSVNFVLIALPVVPNGRQLINMELEKCYILPLMKKRAGYLIT